MSPLPPAFRWLNDEGAPRHLVAALALYGTKELAGPAHNPVIIGWAQELGALDVYVSDEVPWCGLFVAKIMNDAGRLEPKNFFRATAWENFGGLCGGGPQLGDVLVFLRQGGGHVGLYVGEGLHKGAKVYWVLGGNQGNAVSIVPIEQARLYAARRPLYFAKPKNIRRVEIGKVSQAELSLNEA